MGLRFLIVVVGALVMTPFGYGWTGYTDEPSKDPVGPPPGFDLSPPGDRASDEGTVSVEEDEPSPDAPPPSADVPEDEPKTTPRETSGATDTPTKGDKGDPGDRGDRGDTGPQGPQGIQGPPGLNADLCSNIAGIQTQPGWKKWPQRYWSFRPRQEKRVLSVNKRGHLVCVTQRWIRTHSLFARH